MNDGRRGFFSVAGLGLLLAACRRERQAEADPTRAGPGDLAESASAQPRPPKPGAEPGEDVGAVEDLMREHGVIRRVLVVYREAAARLQARPGSVPPDALQRAADLMRTFGEDYHEKKLEEAHIFPAVQRTGGPAASDVATLIAQHQRGREITEFVLASTHGSIAAADAPRLATALVAFSRMYEAHAAREDTVLFPAWKKGLSPRQLDEMGDRFEQIEHETFGKDGFDDAVERIAAIERELGIELATLTAPPPPHDG